jgi:hypothetical protein
MIPASSVANCARTSIGTGTLLAVAGEDRAGGVASLVHCDQASIQAAMPRRRNSAKPNP